MLNTPRTEKRKENFIENSKNQLKHLENSLNQISKEEVLLGKKITKIQHHLSLNKNRKEEVKLLISKIIKEIEEAEALQFSHQKENLSEEEITRILQEDDRNFEDYKKGYYPPSVLEDLGIPLP